MATAGSAPAAIPGGQYPVTPFTGGRPRMPAYGTQAYYDAIRADRADADGRQFQAQKAVLEAQRSGVAARQSGTTYEGDPYQYETDGTGGRRARVLPEPITSYGDVARWFPTNEQVPRQPMPPQVPPPPQANRDAAEAAAYGRAKDSIGKSAAAGMKALSREMNLRGISGSGIETAGTGRVIGGAVGQLGEVSRDQAIERLHRDQGVEDRNFAAAQGQRNADMGWLQTERGQDIEQQRGQAAPRVSLIEALMRRNAGRLY